METSEKESLDPSGEKGVRKTHWVEVSVLLLVIFVASLYAIQGESYRRKEGSVRSWVSRVQSDLKEISVALEKYQVDHHALPPPVAPDVPPGNATAHFFVLGPHLTTPIAYLTSIPIDPFKRQYNGKQGIAEISYGYWLTPKGEGVLMSTGPDQRISLELNSLVRIANSADFLPSQSMLQYAYDSTNGTRSTGDIFRIHQ